CGLREPPTISKPVPRVGYLSSTPAPTSRRYDAFVEGLRDLGYIQGQNITVDFRWAENELDRVDDLASELVGLPVDVLVAQGNVEAVAATRATSTIPIVFFSVADPVGIGLVSSLARPGGNATGLQNSSADTSSKYTEFLRELI